ncbi:MAG: MtnX-like HAD-IB family phosphatase [Candidatus Omnitrophota bacterium]
MAKLRFFLDFDGTIAKSDVVDLILERFGLRQWTEIEKLWIEGKIGSRECLSRQMDLVNATQEEFKSLVDEVEVDPYFADFLETAKSLEVPVAVVSDGFDVVINRILKRVFSKTPELLVELPVYSNSLKRTATGYKIYFPEGPLCEHACANCKVRAIRQVSRENERIVFVGDGMSDRFAAQTAHVTFAKNKLLKFCREKEIPHVPYADFREVEAWLAKEKEGSHAFV